MKYELSDSTTTKKFTIQALQIDVPKFSTQNKRVILHLLQNLLHILRNYYSFLDMKQKSNSLMGKTLVQIKFANRIQPQGWINYYYKSSAIFYKDN